MSGVKHIGAALMVLALAGALAELYHVLNVIRHRRYSRMMAKREAIALASVEALPASPARDRTLDFIRPSHRAISARVSRILQGELNANAQRATAVDRRRRRLREGKLDVVPFLFLFLFLCGAMCVVIGFVMMAERARASQRCLLLGYPDARVTWNFHAFCVRTVQQTQEVRPLP